MRIRAAVFDLGDTIWPYDPSEGARRFAVLRTYQRLAGAIASAPEPGDIDRALGRALASWVERELVDHEQPASHLLVMEALADLGVELPEDLAREVTGVFLGTEPEVPRIAPDTLAALGILDQRGIAMGCVTNTLLLREGIDDVLWRLGLRRYFRSVVVSSELGRAKPHPSLFQRALDELGVGAEEAVFVGDTPEADTAGAKAVGMRTVQTHQYREKPVEREEARPDAVIGRIAELPALLDRWEQAVD